MCNNQGSYRVVLGRNVAGEVLASGGGNFGSEQSHEIRVPVDYTPDEEAEHPPVGEGQILVTVVIQLDDFPEEVGWRIDRLGLRVEDVFRVPTGIYAIPETTVVRTIVLDKNELYSLHIYDVVGDGIQDGYGAWVL